MKKEKSSASEIEEESPPAHKIQSPEWVLADAIDVEVRKIHELADLVFVPPDVDPAEKQAWYRRALDQYVGLAPRDTVEGMLAAQMVGAHQAALECLRRAALTGQSLEVQDLSYKHAQKLMALFTQQVAALDKHRGKGQQKVTVEHVNVAPGAQAIVGHVQTGAQNAPSNDPEMLEVGKTLTEMPAQKKTGRRR